MEPPHTKTKDKYSCLFLVSCLLQYFIITSYIFVRMLINLVLLQRLCGLMKEVSKKRMKKEITYLFHV
jgi:hypothetical protein